MEDVSGTGAAERHGRKVSNGDGSVGAMASLKTLGNSKTVRTARTFVSEQANEAPVRTAAIAIGVGLAAGFLLRGKPKSNLFR